ncbi:hypothetical protein [uncultured Psychroserpens sp.]|uniref:hypothetical protein n=1 Tax=uncultured Psychroserpens sp. TaxID=255436 RepID=UPI0026307560|nr:hypothetical protein [uncultured Psychroserpens sp.]
MEKFEKIVKEIFDLIAEYGIKNKPLDFRNPEKITEKDRTEFITQVHKGFRLGQDLIIQEIVPLLKELKLLKENEKQAKRDKDKDLIQQIKSDINLAEYKIKILRHFADFIAWQVFQKDYYKARRFFSGDKNRPDLLNTNLDSVLTAVQHFHKQDEINFALITDLTSFIDIGDILLIKGGEIGIVECKEGEVQEKVFEFIDSASKEDFDVTKIDYSDKNKKFFDQVERTLKQMEKGVKATDFLKKEEGTDPFSDTKITILESTNPQEYYFEYLIDLIEESKKNNSTYGEIEEIIYIGIYRENKRPISPHLFKGIVEHIYEKNIIVDYVNLIGIPLKEPIFFKPFGVENIFDILFGRVKIYLAINLEKLIELFNSKGIPVKWLSRKETHKILDYEKRFRPFVFENRALEITVDGQSMTLGDSFLIYLLLDNIKPTSYVERYLNLK